MGLQLARVATGGLAGAGFTTGLAFSLDGNPHPVNTYVLLYGGAGVFSLVCAVLWIVIEHRKRIPAPPAVETLQGPDASASKRVATAPVIDDAMTKAFDEAEAELAQRMEQSPSPHASRPGLRHRLLGLLDTGTALQGRLRTSDAAGAAYGLDQDVEFWISNVTNQLERAGRGDLADAFRTNSPYTARDFMLALAGPVAPAIRVRSRLDEKVDALREIVRGL